MKVAPCKVCDRRRLGCHAECDDYKSWKAELAKVSEARVKEQEATPVICRKVVKQIWKEMKGR